MITLNRSNLYILSNNSIFDTSNNYKLISANIILDNATKIEYSEPHIYVLDNQNIHIFNTLNENYSLLISGPIDNFTISGDNIIYDKFNQIYKYHRIKKITHKLNGLDGNTIDLVGDNQNLFLCYNTYIQRYNYITGYKSNIITNISNIVSISYDGLLLYLLDLDSIKIYTKDGLNYTENINITEESNSIILSEVNEINGTGIIVSEKSIYYYNYKLINIYNKHNLTTDDNTYFKSILINNNNYISDTFNHRIIKVDANTLVSTNFITGLNFPRGISYNEGDGFLYVVDSGIDKILSFNIDTGVQNDYSQYIYGITDLTFKLNQMYITSYLQNIIYKIDMTNNNSLSLYSNTIKPYYLDPNILIS
jgi:hypothetical protein